jgi:protein-tyrosine phosphatase
MSEEFSFDNIDNFRDFGSYHTTDGNILKSGILYRSGDLDRASKEDLNKLKSLNIRTIIDLRTSKEIKKKPVTICSEKRIHIPLNITESTRHRLKPYMGKKNVDEQILNAIDSVYRDMVGMLKPQIGEIFKNLLSKNEFPLLIHCHVGKDRTGFIIAIIQMALQVEKKSIIKDYLTTNHQLLPGTKRMLKKMRIATFGLIPTWNFELASMAQEKFINTIINIIDQDYKGIKNYLAECGISEQDLALIKQNIYVNS